MVNKINDGKMAVPSTSFSKGPSRRRYEMPLTVIKGLSRSQSALHPVNTPA